MTIAWVIGGGGLLGSALVSELCRRKIELFIVSKKFDWSNEFSIFTQLDLAVKQFSNCVTGRHWHIYWAAGNSSMSSSEGELKFESRILEHLIDCLLSDLNLQLSKGTFIFSSSAGAIYAGTQFDLITEITPTHPVNAYGRHKIAQENFVSKLNKNGEGSSIWNFRISTLYGALQKQGKRQGLLSEIARRSLRNQVIHIYVPLQTMRDYIDVKVAAQEIITTVSEVDLNKSIGIKIIASEVSTSIAQILSFYKNFFKRNLRLVTSANEQSAAYKRVLRFRSICFLNSCVKPRTELLIGIANIIASERRAIADQKGLKSEN
jgi:UDP-glucose 4-epimerase